MSLDPSRTPVVLVTGQSVDRSRESGPLQLAEAAARIALDAAPGVAARIERVSVVNILAHRAGPAPASDLAKSLGLRHGLPPEALETTVIGGTMPQALVTRAAADIASGRLSATLIAGAEALSTTRLKPQGSHGSGAGARRQSPAVDPEPAPDPVFGLVRQDLSDEERSAGLVIPVFVYPLFESVLASRAGRSNAEQRDHIGRFLAPFSAVAAANPYAWFPEELAPEAIAAPLPDNRLVAEPYTKRMVSFLGSAHGSALVVTSLEVARNLGLGDDVIFIWAGADAEEIWNPISRPDLGRAPALASAARAVLASAGVSIDDVNHLDLYSCFPSAVEVAAAELGIALDDTRGLTVTGGLPYFGGPGSNYVSHSIATMVERLKAAGANGGSSHELGLVTGVAWYLTRHAVGVYGTGPPRRGEFTSTAVAAPAVPTGPAAPTSPTAGAATSPDHVALAVTASVSNATPARIEAGTVIYDRSGVPQSAPVIATLADGTRVAANAFGEDLAEAAELGAQAPLVGRTVQVNGGSPLRYRLS